jgi:hypothetical protein
MLSPEPDTASASFQVPSGFQVHLVMILSEWSCWWNIQDLSMKPCMMKRYLQALKDHQVKNVPFESNSNPNI